MIAFFLGWLCSTSRSGGLHAALDRSESAAVAQGAVAVPTGTVPQAQALHQALFGPRGSSNRGLPGNQATVMYRAYDELPLDKATLAEGVVHQGTGRVHVYVCSTYYMHDPVMSDIT